MSVPLTLGFCFPQSWSLYPLPLWISGPFSLHSCLFSIDHSTRFCGCPFLRTCILFLVTSVDQVHPCAGAEAGQLGEVKVLQAPIGKVPGVRGVAGQCQAPRAEAEPRAVLPASAVGPPEEEAPEEPGLSLGPWQLDSGLQHLISLGLSCMLSSL